MQRYLLQALIASILVMSVSACTGVRETEVGRTPVGSVISGETKDIDSYIERVRQSNEENTRRASENPTFKEGSHSSGFDGFQERY